MTRILITNDDGISSPGLHAVAIALHNEGHEVLAVAPSGERSGWGAGVGTLDDGAEFSTCLLYTSPSPRDATLSRMPSSA